MDWRTYAQIGGRLARGLKLIKGACSEARPGQSRSPDEPEIQPEIENAQLLRCRDCGEL